MSAITAIGTTNTINTGNGNDFVHISEAPGLLGLLGLYKVDINGTTQYMTKNQLEHTNFQTNGGHDVVIVDPNVDANLHIDTGSGNDVVRSGAGNDVIDTGSGNDVASGGDGDDLMLGGQGVNVLNGGNGNDVFVNTGGLNIDNGGPGHDAFINLGGVNFNRGGPGVDWFANLGGINFNQQ